MMTAANMLTIALGILVLIALARGTIDPRPPVPLTAPWSMGLGFAVMVRADFWNRLYFLTLAYLGQSNSTSAWASFWKRSTVSRSAGISTWTTKRGD